MSAPAWDDEGVERFFRTLMLEVWSQRLGAIALNEAGEAGRNSLVEMLARNAQHPTFRESRW